jgi:hypothetical protein
LRATRPAASITAGLEVLVQEVIAAITTEPSPARAALVRLRLLVRRRGQVLGLRLVAALGVHALDLVFFGLRLRPGRPGWS